MEFEKGQKIVCINDSDWPAWARATYKDFPVKGQTYTVRDVEPGIMPITPLKDPTGKNPLSFTGHRHPAVFLEEIVNEVHAVSKREMGYAAARFAPMEPLKDKTSEKEKVGFVRRKPKTIDAPAPKPKRRVRELVPA